MLSCSATLDDGERKPVQAVGTRPPGLRSGRSANTDREALVELRRPRRSHQLLGRADALKKTIDQTTVALCAVQLGVCDERARAPAEDAKTASS